LHSPRASKTIDVGGGWNATPIEPGVELLARDTDADYKLMLKVRVHYCLMSCASSFRMLFLFSCLSL
jgi:hypothetical protein